MALAALNVRILSRDRRAVPPAAPDDHRAEGERRRQAADDPGTVPAPLLALDHAEDQRSDRDGEQQRAGQVGNPPSAGRPALVQPPAGQQCRRHADRDVHQEHQAPVRGGDEQSAERGAKAGGGRADRGQQGNAVGPVRGREGVQHQRQGRWHEEGGAESLHHPEGDQSVRRRRDRAQQRAGGEQPQAEHEDAPAPEQVRDPRGRQEKRGEHDVVGIQDPRQRGDRRGGERPRDVRERDVHDRRVDEGDGAAQGGDRQDGPG